MIGTTMIRWHRAHAFDGYPYWYAEIDGIKLAEAVNTSQTGTENYPWEWHLTAEGIALRDVPNGHTFGVQDTLRSVKQTVREQFR